MQRDQRLVLLSWDHHQGLVMALRIQRELPSASDAAVAQLYSDLLSFWSAGLLPHFRTEDECLLARLIRHVPHEHEAVRQTQRDHLDLHALVATMRDASDTTERREALASFGRRLRDHIRWEERVLFDATEQQLDDAELDALGREIAERIATVQPAPSGRAPGE